MDEKEDLELKKERDFLKFVNSWIENYLKGHEEEYIALKEKLEIEFKKASGSYSQDYENVYNMLSIMENRLRKLDESKDKPYFGRIDFKERLSSQTDSFYIGKHPVRESDGSMELVLDWRAPIADLYYSATLGKAEYKAVNKYIEGDFKLKRRFTYTKEKDGTIDRYFDEGERIIVAQSDGEGRALDDEFLRITLDEASTEKLKEIVATIAKEQNEIIRSEKNIPIVVQGSAGAGKTTVALHRLSYLLYKYKDSLKGSQVCIVAPNDLFIEYISEVLPDLGSHDVVHTTFEELILKELKVKKYGESKDEILKKILEDDEEGRILGEVSKLKGSMEFLSVLKEMREKIEEGIGVNRDILLEGEILYSKEELVRIFKEDLKHLNLNERLRVMEGYCKKNSKSRLKLVEGKIEAKYDKKVKILKNLYEDDEYKLREKIKKEYDTRDEILKKLKLNGNKSIKTYFSSLNKKKVTEYYEDFITNKDFITSSFERVGIKLEDKILDALTSFNKNKISADDLGALMYLKIQLSGVDTFFSHLVVDEAQDYSLVQIEVLRQMARQDSITLVGDLAQGIYSFKGIENWEDLHKLFPGGFNYKELRQSYRSTVEIVEEANKTLKRMPLKIKEAIPVLRRGPIPQKLKLIGGDISKTIDYVLEIMKKEGRRTLALVTKTNKEALEAYKELKKTHPEFSLIEEKTKVGDLKNVVIPSYLTKGLEFDCVIIENEGAYGESLLDLRLKYVALTRALHLEFILI